MELGTYGVWTSFRQTGAEHAPEAVRLAEALGFGTFWLGGSPRLAALRPLLQATRTIVLATGVVNVWNYEPDVLAAEHAELTGAFPGRVLLGIGIGHPEATGDYGKPLSTMRDFLDGLDRAERPVPRDERCLAALGPKMLDLSAERSRGTHPYFVPVQHTKDARARLGPTPLLAPEIACVVDPDDGRGRATARRYARLYLGLRNYTNNLLRSGFDPHDIEGEGSDRLIDAVVPHGTADQIADVARAHVGAGADHVCLQTTGVAGIPLDEWSSLAAALNG